MSVNQNYLYQMRKAQRIGPFSKERYEAWRQKIPYSDEQIAVVLEDLATTQSNDFLKKKYLIYAATVRKGHLSGRIFSLAISSLVTKCALCGEKALYRYGSLGRCKEHKYVATLEKWSALLDARHLALDKDITEKMKTVDRSKAHRKARGTFQRHRK